MRSSVGCLPRWVSPGAPESLVEPGRTFGNAYLRTERSPAEQLEELVHQVQAGIVDAQALVSWSSWSGIAA
ncbi:MAG TPA: hypothetical protein VGH43_17765 [Jatrophihabitans sp.]|jgi:hypothetical protein